MSKITSNIVVKTVGLWYTDFRMYKIEKDNQILLSKKSDVLSLPMFGLMKNCKDIEIFFDGIDSFCLIKQQKTVCFLGENFDFFEKMLKTFDGEITFCGMTEKAMNFLQKRFELLWTSNCFLYVFNGKPLEVSVDPDIQPMKSQYWKLVSDGTFYGAEKEDICECIKNRPSSALYIDGQPVCWCLTHIEGSLGMLYTLPQHRKKGYALRVMKDISAKLLANGDTPYAFIVETNIASQNLAPKYNLEYVCPFSWCGVHLNKEKMICK